MSFYRIPSRLYSLFGSRYVGTAFCALFFQLLGCLFPILLITSLANHDVPSDGLAPGLIMTGCGMFVFIGFGRFLWSSIPPRVTVSTPDQAGNLFSRQQFILILWSFQDYRDSLGSVNLGFNKDAGGDVEAEISRDSEIREIAQRFGRVTLRLWKTSAAEPVGSLPKSIHVICVDDRWKEIITIAFHAATVIVAFRGSGAGLAWELGQIDGCQSLKEKTVIVDDSLLKEQWLKAIEQALTAAASGTAKK